MSFDEDKLDPRRQAWIAYRLRNAIVYRSPPGRLFTDYLDGEHMITPEVDEAALTDVLRAYIADELSSDRERVRRQAELVLRHAARDRCRVLDVGCGGGLLLAELRARGAQVEGTELNDSRLLFARREHGLTVHKLTLDAGFFRRERTGYYDAIAFFDVLEHVNFPARALREAALLLRPGGVLLVETPCREGALHRAGELGYRLSRGRYPTLLNLMYSNHPYGHKQIFARAELRELAEQAGLSVERLDSLHELALPYASYLERLAGSARAARLLEPAARVFFTWLPLHNKLALIARKPAYPSKP